MRKQISVEGSRRPRWASALIGVATIAVAVSACSSEHASTGAADTGKNSYTIIYAGLQPSTSPQGQAETDFASLVEKSSGGRIHVDLHFNGDLGSTTALASDVKLGTVQMTALVAQTYASFYAPIGILGLPFIFTSYAQAAKALQTPGMKSLQATFASKTGIHILSWEQAGFVQLLSKKGPITTLSDMRGLRVRTIAGTIPTKEMQAVGAVPVPLNSDETYTAFQQNTIDADGLPITTFYGQKEYELAKYMTIVNLTDNLLGVSINQKFFESLPASLRTDVEKAVNSATVKEIKLTESAETSDLAKMQALGVKVTTMPTSERDQWKAETANLDASYSASLLAALRGS